jgi:NADH:ubiquinone oxidoreductase subunit 2 (subunit N)
MGINQTHLRTLLAYSSIRHLGWILSMVAIRKTPIWMFYFSIYCLITTPLFLTFILLNTKTIFDLYNIYKIHYLAPLIITLLILSLAGVPPLTGFSPKLIVIATIVNHSYSYFTLLMLLLGSYFSLYYYLRIAFRCIIVQTTKLPTYTPSVHLLVPITFFIATSIIGLIMIIIYALITID